MGSVKFHRVLSMSDKFRSLLARLAVFARTKKANVTIIFTLSLIPIHHFERDHYYFQPDRVADCQSACEKLTWIAL
jgi:hypothetical protein